MAAQFDADVDYFLRENEQLRDKVIAAEKAKRELETKVQTLEMQENPPKPQSPQPSFSTRQLKVGMQVQQITREREKEELLREVEAEKLEVANLEHALQHAKQEAATESKRLQRELEEAKAANEIDVRNAERARDKEIRWLHKELEASKYRTIHSGPQPPPGPSELPAPGKPERLSGVWNQHCLDGETLDVQLQTHFSWPEQEFNEVQELREELRVMQHLHEQVSGSTANEALEETKAILQTEFEELQSLREELHASKCSTKHSGGDRNAQGVLQGKQEDSSQKRIEELESIAEKATVREKYLKEEVQRWKAKATTRSSTQETEIKELEALADKATAREKQLAEEVHQKAKELEALAEKEAARGKQAEEEVQRRQAKATTRTSAQARQETKEIKELEASVEKAAARENYLEEEVQRWQAQATKNSTMRANQVEEQLVVLQVEQAELQKSKEELQKSFKSERMEADALKMQAASLLEEVAQENTTVRKAKEAHLGPTSSAKDERDDVEMLRTLAALRCLEAHWYP